MKDDQQQNEIPFTEEIQAGLYGQIVGIQAAIRALVLSLPDPVEYHIRLSGERDRAHAMLLNQPCPDGAIASFLDATRYLDVELSTPATPADPGA